MPSSGSNPRLPLRLADLGQQLGLSAATVSRALSGHPSIGAATALKVRTLAKKLGYQPNAMAAGLRTGHSQTLGVIVPHLRNNYFAQVVQSIEEAAAQAGYHLLICQSNEDAKCEHQKLLSLLHAQVAGILVSVARTTPDCDAFEAVRSQGLPLVFFDRFIVDANVSAVVIDDRAGGYQATRHLLAQGYRRIAHLAGPPHLTTYRNRHLGYEDALREAGLPVVPEWVLVSDLQLADGIAATQQLLALPEVPDAIFAASDFAALGCLQVLQAQGCRIPAEYGVVGFGDEFFSQHITPALSSVGQHSELMGRSAVQLLLQLKQADKPEPARHILLQPTLRARASSTR